MPLESLPKTVGDIIEKALLTSDQYNLGVMTVFLSYLLKQFLICNTDFQFLSLTK